LPNSRHRGPVFGPGIALALAQELLVDPDRIEEFEQREIEDVGPDDRGRPVISVIVPGAIRGQDQIAARGEAALALDRRVAAIVGKDRAAGVWRVHVDRGNIARVVDRHRAADRARDLQPAAEPGLTRRNCWRSANSIGDTSALRAISAMRPR